MTSDQSVQLLTAALGFAATLGAVFLTWYLTARGERQRIEIEDDRRWQADRFRVLRDFQAEIGTIDRTLSGAVQAYRVFRANTGKCPDRDDMATAMLEQINEATEAVEAQFNEADRLPGELRSIR